jgi:hypothetical protein
VTSVAVTGTNPTPDLSSVAPSQIAVGAGATEVILQTSGAFVYNAYITALPTGASFPSYHNCAFVGTDHANCHVTLPATVFASDTSVVLTAHNAAVAGSPVTLTVGAPSDGGTD